MRTNNDTCAQGYAPILWISALGYAQEGNAGAAGTGSRGVEGRKQRAGKRAEA